MTAPVDWTGLTLAHARDLGSLPPAAQQHWRALLDVEIILADRRNRELLRDRKPVDIRRHAEAILAALPQEDPEIVMARQAILYDAEAVTQCGCQASGPWCPAHRYRVRHYGDPLLDIPVSWANYGQGPLKKKNEAAA